MNEPNRTPICDRAPTPTRPRARKGDARHDGGWRAPRTANDAGPSTLPPWVSPPSLMVAALRRLARAGACAGWGGTPLAWRELENKLRAFSGFRAGEQLGRRSAGPSALAGALAAAAGRGAYDRLWMTEGIGYGYAERFSTRPDSARGPLRSGRGAQLPRHALVPVHTGMGLSFANRLLEADGCGGAGATAERLWKLSCRHGLPGHADLLFEALGLAVRTLRPTRLTEFGAAAAAAGRRQEELFWHGVGRGLYFTPLNLLPSLDAGWRAAENAWHEPIGRAGRRNALAGLAWAVTLVNVRHPRLVAARWRQQSSVAERRAAFANGTASALAIWRGASGADRTVAGLARYRDPGWSRAEREMWRADLESIPGDAGDRAPESLFRYRPETRRAAAS